MHRFPLILAIGLLYGVCLVAADVSDCVKSLNNSLELTTCSANVQVVAESSDDLKLLLYGGAKQNDELELTIGDCAFTVKVIAATPPKFEVVNGPSNDLSLTLQLSDKTITKDGSQEEVQCNASKVLDDAVDGKKKVTLSINKRAHDDYNIVLKGTGITTNLTVPAQATTAAGKIEGKSLLEIKDEEIDRLKIAIYVYTGVVIVSALLVGAIGLYVGIRLVQQNAVGLLKFPSKKKAVISRSTIKKNEANEKDVKTTTMDEAKKITKGVDQESSGTPNENLVDSARVFSADVKK
ncbi:hypothetical protein M3Y94_00689200 [Aphelenchoides besseyi]|nr:hypothetical protein M3Y94_00689200 [Aphelenchoides besseyi]KAI6231507.1 hypothetical protein M3Y95_00389000 [Aphelenchoides besseyi]